MSDTTVSTTEEVGEAEITAEITALFNAGAQFAYRKSRRHPKMRNFIAGVKSNVEVFHLDKVQEELEVAMEALEKLGAAGKLVLWVGTKPAAIEYIKKAADELNHPYITRRWLGGTLSNFEQIRSRVKRLESLESQKESGELEKYTKQERLRLDKEMEKLDVSVGSLRLLTRKPDAVVFIDTQEEAIALAETKTQKIITYGLLNSDCNPTGINYVVPGNDNSPKSIAYFVAQFKEAYLTGKKNAPKEEEAVKPEGEKAATAKKVEK